MPAVGFRNDGDNDGDSDALLITPVVGVWHREQLGPLYIWIVAHENSLRPLMSFLRALRGFPSHPLEMREAIRKKKRGSEANQIRKASSLSRALGEPQKGAGTAAAGTEILSGLHPRIPTGIIRLNFTSSPSSSHHIILSIFPFS